MYMGENRSGAIYLAAMALFFLPIGGLVLFRDSVSRMVVQSGIRPSLFVYSVLAFFLVGLVVWLFNAVLAYYRAANSWSEPFLGVEKQIWPLSCSVLFPGWGQFVNGQPIKGLFFLLFGMIGTFSVFVFSVAQYSWPVIEADPARHVFENFLAAALLLVPVVLLMWIVAAYDSFRSCQKLFRKRLSLKTPGYRVGGPSVVRGLVPRSTAILALLLASAGVFAAGLVGWWARSLAIGIVYLVGGAFFALLDVITWQLAASINGAPPVIPEPLANAIRQLYLWQQGRVGSMRIVGAAVFLVGLVVIGSIVRGRWRARPAELTAPDRGLGESA